MKMMLERYGVGLVAGAVTTIALLWLMQAVISFDGNPLNDAPDYRPIDFARLMEDVDPDIIKPENKPPPPPDVVPPVMAKPDPDSMGDTGWELDTSFEAPDIGQTISISGFSDDGEYLPLRKVNPIYPRRAQQRGIEGFVILQFTVTETGSVENPVVIESEPPGIFDRAAIAAALKFKYKPRTVDGVAIRVDGVKHRIGFELEEAY